MEKIRLIFKGNCSLQIDSISGYDEHENLDSYPCKFRGTTYVSFAQ